MTYSLDDVAKRKAELKAAMPELELNSEGDFGYRLEAYDPVSGMTVIVMRPFRLSNKRSLAEMNQPAAKVVAFFEHERRRARERELPPVK